MRKSTLFVFLGAAMFALGGLFFKIIPWDALAIGSARSVLAAVCIFLFLLCRKHHFVLNKTVLAAAVSIACTNTLYALANKLTTAGNAIVLEYAMPVFAIIIMLVFYRKKPTKGELATCFFVLLGILCFFVDSISAGNALGNLLALLSGVSYACYFIFNSREESDPFTAILIAYGISLVIGLPSLLRTDVAGSPLPVLLAVAGLGILQQGAGHIFLSLGIKDTPPVTASLISGIEPVLNPILVAVFYHELLTPISLLGATIVLISITAYNCLTNK